MRALDKARWKCVAIALPIGIVGGAANGLMGALTGWSANGAAGFGLGLVAGSYLGVEMARRELAKRADEINRETQANIDRIKGEAATIEERLRAIELRAEREDDYRMEQNEREL